MLALFVLIAVGCKQTQEIGKTTKQLFTGTTEATVDRNVDEVNAAIDATAAELNYIRIGSNSKQGKKGTETTVIIRNSADQRITVTYRIVSPTQTHVAVGTGAFGDSNLRQNVWDTLRLKLGVLGSSTSATRPTSQPM